MQIPFQIPLSHLHPSEPAYCLHCPSKGNFERDPVPKGTYLHHIAQHFLWKLREKTF